MKRLLILFSLVVMLVGCGNRDVDIRKAKNEVYKQELDKRFIITNSGRKTLIIDTETGVQYLIYDEQGFVLVGKNGTPRLANGWRDYD